MSERDPGSRPGPAPGLAPAFQRLIGRTAGRKYLIARFIGAGGMGAVFAGRDTDLDREVAVKVILPEYMADPGAGARMLKEARLTAKLDHPGIVKIHTVEQDDDGLFIMVQELLKVHGDVGVGQNPSCSREQADELGDGFRPIRVDSLPAGRVSDASGADAEATSGGAAARRLDSPRVVLITALAAAVRDAASCGDLETARIALGALNRLLGDAGEIGDDDRIRKGAITPR